MIFPPTESEPGKWGFGRDGSNGYLAVYTGDRCPIDDVTIAERQLITAAIMSASSDRLIDYDRSSADEIILALEMRALYIQNSLKNGLLDIARNIIEGLTDGVRR